MADLSIPARDSIAQQAELFRLAEKEEGLSIRVLHQKRPNTLAISTMKGWRDGSAMPAWALFELGEAGVPDHLLSLVGKPYSRFVVTEPDGDGDLDRAAIDAADFAHEVAKAHHPDSPGGLHIVHPERAVIEAKRIKACASMRCVGSKAA